MASSSSSGMESVETDTWRKGTGKQARKSHCNVCLTWVDSSKTQRHESTPAHQNTLATLRRISATSSPQPPVPSSPTPSLHNADLVGEVSGRMNDLLAQLSKPRESTPAFDDPQPAFVAPELPPIPMEGVTTPGFQGEALSRMSDELREYMLHGGSLNVDGGTYLGPGQAPEEYHQTGAPRPRQTKNMPLDARYIPYPDRVAAVLDVCRHLPRSIFSDSQMETINWCCATLGLDNIPSVSWLKEMSADLQDKIGIRTLRFQGALGHVYYANSLQDQIAQEFGNPLISPHIRAYPEDVEPGAGMGEARQFQRWRHEADPAILSPMLRIKNQSTGLSNDFFVFEPARLSEAGGGEICMPFRFFTREIARDGTSHTEFFVEAWRLEAVVGDQPEHGGYIVNEYSVFTFPASHLQLPFPMLRATYKALSVPDPGVIHGKRNELHGEVSAWTRVKNSVLGNDWRAKAKDHRVVTFMMWLYCDDTSGNSSKKWNKHNSFLWTAAGLPRSMSQQQQNVHFSCTSNLAPPLEMLDGIASQLEEGQRDGWWVWDYANNEPVLVIPEVLALLGDNPMQSELSCHIGLMGKYFCRICKVYGRDADDGDAVRPTVVSPLDAENPASATSARSPLGDDGDASSDAASMDSSLAGSSTEASNASTSGISGSSAASSAPGTPKKSRKRPLETMQQMYERSVRFLSNNPFRRKEESQRQLRSIFTEASRVGGKTNAGKMQTQFGVKDTFQSTFMEKIWDFGRKLRGSTDEKQKKMDDFIQDNIPEDHTSPVWRIQDLDPHKDTPVEVLHVVLLGFVKYFWRDIISRLKDEEKAILATRLSSFDVSGLGMSPLVGTTLVYYAGSLTGRDFRALAQAAPFILYDLASEECYEAWVALCRLIPLIWQPEITDLDTHLKEMEDAIEYFLTCTAKWTPRWFNKPKFHLLRHLPFHVRRFGPAILFATEAFEAFNAIIRAHSIHSNRHAPSRDIAVGLAQCNRVRHIFSGGLFIERSLPSDGPRAQSLPPIFPGPEPPKREDLRTAGYACLALMESGSGPLRGYPAQHLGISSTALPSVGSVTVPAKGVPVPWSYLVSHAKLPLSEVPERATEHRYVACSDVIVAADEKARVGSWALCGLLDHRKQPVQSLTLVQVVEIWQELRSSAHMRGHADKLLVQEAQVQDEVEPGYLMYSIKRGNYKLIKVSDIVCLVNVQHNCAANACDLSASAPLRQEREDTGKTVPRVKHINADSMLLNVAQHRSARYLGTFRPPVAPLDLHASVMEGTKKEVEAQKTGKKAGWTVRGKSSAAAATKKKNGRGRGRGRGGRGGARGRGGPRGAAAEHPTSGLAREMIQ